MALRYLRHHVELKNAVSTLSRQRNFHTCRKVLQAKWTRAVSDAEKVVGYPTSFLNLRCLLSDEISNIAVYLKKLIGTGHPLLTTARQLVYPSDKVHQTRGLLVLLISKAINKEISQPQRSLAEITELIHTAHLIHNGVIDLKADNSNLEFGNKMAVLCGDFLLAHACVELSALKNVKVVELISQAIADINTSEFFELPIEGECPFGMWKERTTLRYGTLLANACRSSVILAEDSTLLEEAHLFGLHMALAWQANLELNNVKNLTGHNSMDRYSLPAVLSAAGSKEDASRAIERVRNDNVDAALNVLKEFPCNSATLALRNIAGALKS